MRRRLRILVSMVILGALFFWSLKSLWSISPWYKTPAQKLSKVHASLLVGLNDLEKDTSRSQEHLRSLIESIENDDGFASFNLPEKLASLRDDATTVLKGSKRVLRKASKYEALIGSTPEKLRKMADAIRERGDDAKLSETKAGYESLSDSLTEFAKKCDTERGSVATATKGLLATVTLHGETCSLVDSLIETAEGVPTSPDPEFMKSLVLQLRELESRFVEVDRSITTYRTAIDKPESVAVTEKSKK